MAFCAAAPSSTTADTMTTADLLYRGIQQCHGSIRQVRSGQVWSVVGEHWEDILIPTRVLRTQNSELSTRQDRCGFKITNCYRVDAHAWISLYFGKMGYVLVKSRITYAHFAIRPFHWVSLGCVVAIQNILPIPPRPLPRPRAPALFLLQRSATSASEAHTEAQRARMCYPPSQSQIRSTACPANCPT
jgi:hypothetical protein